MSCTFNLWSSAVSSKSCKWTWWVELLQPQMGFLGCRQKLWSHTDKLSFCNACPLSLHVIWLLSTHPHIHPSIPPPLTSTFFLIAAAACMKAYRQNDFHVWGRNLLPRQGVDELESPLNQKYVTLKRGDLKKKKTWHDWENIQPSLRSKYTKEIWFEFICIKKHKMKTSVQGESQ